MPKENNVTAAIVDAAVHVRQELGPGLLESVYEEVLAYELVQRGINVARQVPVPVIYRGLRFEIGFRADLLVENLVVVELKSVVEISAAHRKQIQTYVRLMNQRVGLFLNFGAALMKDGIVRAVNKLPETDRSSPNQ
jgi:GxxExxY protein